MSTEGFIAFDTEDDSRELRAAGRSGFEKSVTQISAKTSGGERFHNRGDVPEFLAWIKAQPELKLVAHNLSYDLGNLFGDTLDEVETLMAGGRMVSAGWGGKEFGDTFNLWPMSLKTVGAAFGLEKKEFDSGGRDYVDRDVDITFAAMDFIHRFCEKRGITRLPLTLGGLCVKTWRAMGGKNCQDTGKLSREALYGGRVELFKKRSESGRGVRYTDMNSLYPHCMTGEFPGPLGDWGNKLAPHGVATVEMRLPETELCLLPERDADGRIHYRYGQIKGTWCIPEIEHAVEHGGKIVRVFACMGTKHTMRPYADFIDQTYRLRLAAKNEAEKLLYKLLMNNLYGRLAASGELSWTVPRTPENEKKGAGFGKKTLMNFTVPAGGEVNWCHAAYVTARGRIALHGYMSRIGPDRLIYCDTDSCIFDGEAIPFPTGKGLGEMKVEECCSGCGMKWKDGHGCGEEKRSGVWGGCETQAPKLYRLGKETRAKGVPTKCADEFYDIGKVSFEQPFRYREACRFFDKNNSRKLSVWRKVGKERQESYDRKKIVGNRYFPRKSSDSV